MSNAALVIAHPGHELRAFGWAVQARPLTFVLTHGDGGDRASRLASTSHILADIGAEPGCIYGRFADRALYDVFLHQRYDVLTRLRDELATALIDAGTTVVACDGVEYYNPSHDVCHYVAASAVRVAAVRSGRTIRLYDFPLIAAPDACAAAARHDALVVRLDDGTFARKIEHARRYPELQAEVDRALAANGADAFRVEYLCRVTSAAPAPAAQPFYEQYGERQVAAGQYAHVIRFDPHLLGAQRALEPTGAEVPNPCGS